MEEKAGQGLQRGEVSRPAVAIGSTEQWQALQQACMLAAGHNMQPAALPRYLPLQRLIWWGVGHELGIQGKEGARLGQLVG
jgi:hypothetical protein